MKIFIGLFLCFISMTALAVPDYCGDPVISPSPIPPECIETDPTITMAFQRREDQNTMVCQFDDGGWYRLNNMTLQIPQNNLTDEERCELLRCVFNKASWCK